MASLNVDDPNRGKQCIIQKKVKSHRNQGTSGLVFKAVLCKANQYISTVLVKYPDSELCGHISNIECLNVWKWASCALAGDPFAL
jgi:hypothetical protein